MADHLTIANPTLQVFIDATPPGMAHWSGTGPARATCGSCAFVKLKVARDTGDVTARCKEYRRIMRGRHGFAPKCEYPPETKACRHYMLALPKVRT